MTGAFLSGVSAGVSLMVIALIFEPGPQLATAIFGLIIQGLVLSIRIGMLLGREGGGPP